VDTVRYPARVSTPVPPSLPFSTRLWFAWVCLIRVFFDSRFAARAFAARDSLPMLGSTKALDGASSGPASGDRDSDAGGSPRRLDAAPAHNAGLQLLALLQREGRFVDFLEQDVTTFSDEEVGAAARIVHDGCRKALHKVTSVQPVRTEAEGTSVTLQAGFSPFEVKLVGNLQGEPPYRGTLRHRGWRAGAIRLPEFIDGHDAAVLAPAEVEL
jgi:hypothetical protein